MNNKKETIWQEWLDKADEDLLSLNVLLKHREGSPSTGCFLAQQTIEKLLKGLLIFNGAELEKLHDLVALINILKTYEPEIIKFKERLAVITRYYIETRYPADRPGFSW